jgi:hypothetical protein
LFVGWFLVLRGQPDWVAARLPDVIGVDERQESPGALGPAELPQPTT